MPYFDRIPMPLTLALVGLYLLILIFTVIRIMLDTHSSSKTWAYLLVVSVLPVVGIFLYFSVGMNLRKRLPQSKVKQVYKQVTEAFRTSIPDRTGELVEDYKDMIGDYSQLINLIGRVGNEPLSLNRFNLLVNGEVKFPDVVENLAGANNHIHMEYYAWENDIRGNQVKDILLKKAGEGVHVRVLYDAYASRAIRSNIVREMKAGGIEVYPVIKVKLLGFANRVNHRDHRKIIIIDGRVGYLGGINMSDRYDNSIDTGLYWRDTHVKITGPLVLSIQRHFLINWNIFTPVPLQVDRELFPSPPPSGEEEMKGLAQVMAGGPVYRLSNIMLTYFKIFNLANKNLYITNPYFIPNESVLDALKQAALSGVDVRIMVPKKSDSMIVGLSANSFFEELLDAGVRIFLYRKGFVHAKTVVADQKLSVVGTANMDIRSFDLNFEIMSVIYSEEFSGQMESMFLSDLKECEEIDPVAWKNRSLGKRLVESTARLVSAFL